MGIKTYLISSQHSPSETIPLRLSRSCFEAAEQAAIRAIRLNRTIVGVSIISVFVNIGLAIAAFIIASMRDSAATYAFAADCLLDMLSSTILLWRFFDHRAVGAELKEKKACIFLGAFFGVSGIAVIIKAGIDIHQQDLPVRFYALNVLSVTGTLICVLMAAIKYALAKKAQSGSLLLDAVNSVISGMLASVIILSDLTYRLDDRVWYLEPLLSIILSALLIVYGAKVMYENRLIKEEAVVSAT